ncbi:MAG TPA: PEP-CTERM sorting domain-containing protein [Verrucomicrobiae bacterium]|nr:PEP-CTERM sorting domain-containing protein [Verrucomicrobiae bacterium]
MKLHISIITVACLVACSSQAQTIFSTDFTGDTPGSSPTGWTSVSPSAPAALNGAIVTNVSGNNAVNMYDYSTTANARLEQDFTTSASGLHLSLNFTRNANIAPATSVQGLYVALGSNTLSQGTAANRAVNFRLFNDGSYRVDAGKQNPDGTFNSNPVVSGSNSFGEGGTTFNTHTLDIFAYAGTTGGATLGYTGPGGTNGVLDPHSFAVYIDGAFLQNASTITTANGDYAFQNSSFYSQSNLGRLGLVTGGASSASGIDFLVDNISLSVIPEPSTVALLGAGSMLLIGVLRRTRRSV